jgi:hypothetical protein
VGLVRWGLAFELEDALTRHSARLAAFAFAPVAAAILTLAGDEIQGADQTRSPHLFKTADDCMACHNNLRSPSGEDVSIGASWRGSMMANSARDPYWQAAVRRETLDHPTAAAAIQDECSKCHMPMARTEATAGGREGEVFAHLPVGKGATRDDRLAHDGVSCTICHQITEEKLGTPASFTGGYVVSAARPLGKSPRTADARPIFGPFEVDKGLTAIMHSATEFRQAEASHIRQSELCATCHTLFTKALGPRGELIGEIPEQVPYLEWRHSAFPGERRGCQSCHMPPVETEMPISSVLGQPRAGLARHGFVGGNAFMLRMLNRYREELAVASLAGELDEAIRQAGVNLQTASAAVTVERVDVSGMRLNVDVGVRNLTGHKLPTGYPSRRAWLHVRIRDRAGRPVFESGAVTPTGSIEGNDNDIDAAKFEPHYAEVREPGQVQIYESVMGDPAGVPTTGLLTGVRYLKDNRIVPRGFEKASAAADIAIVGGAAEDADFADGTDRVRYSVDVAGTEGPWQVDVELRFQSVGFRWADNLKKYDASEPRRFVSYYDAMSAASSEILARASATR